VQNLKDSIKLVRKMEKVDSNDQEELFMKENFWIITLKDMETVNGLMEENIMVNGRTTKCMEKGYFIGQTEKYM